MKRIKLLIILLISLFIFNVKADMGAPMIVSHDIMVTNKNGAQCYEGGKKTETVIPYGTTLGIYSEMDGNYVYVSSKEGAKEEYGCYVKYSDVSAKTQSVDMNNDEIEKITPIKGIVLAKAGLNLRKGPFVTFSKLATVPQYTVLTFTHTGGTYWYYTSYNGKNGWVTSMSGYIGFDNDKVLISPEAIKLYDADNKKVVGTIPANTGFSNCLKLNNYFSEDFSYYVIYNGIKGYIRGEVTLYEKIDAPGKIKLKDDYELTDNDGKLMKKLTAGRELEYSMLGYSDSNYASFYVPEFKTVIGLENAKYEYITKATKTEKKTGYLGEGLFGEEKFDRVTPAPEIEDTPLPVIDEPTNNKSKMSTRDIIIIALLGGIFLALTALVIIKLVNSKKKVPTVTNSEEKKVEEKKPEEKVEVKLEPKSEIEEAREVIEKRINSEKKEKDHKEV